MRAGTGETVGRRPEAKFKAKSSCCWYRGIMLYSVLAEQSRTKRNLRYKFHGFRAQNVWLSILGSFGELIQPLCLSYL